MDSASVRVWVHRAQFNINCRHEPYRIGDNKIIISRALEIYSILLCNILTKVGGPTHVLHGWTILMLCTARVLIQFKMLRDKIIRYTSSSSTSSAWKRWSERVFWQEFVVEWQSKFSKPTFWAKTIFIEISLIVFENNSHVACRNRAMQSTISQNQRHMNRKSSTNNYQVYFSFQWVFALGNTHSQWVGIPWMV